MEPDQAAQQASAPVVVSMSSLQLSTSAPPKPAKPEFMRSPRLTTTEGGVQDDRLEDDDDGEPPVIARLSPRGKEAQEIIARVEQRIVGQSGEEATQGMAEVHDIKVTKEEEKEKEKEEATVPSSKITALEVHPHVHLKKLSLSVNLEDVDSGISISEESADEGKQRPAALGGDGNNNEEGTGEDEGAEAAGLPRPGNRNVNKDVDVDVQRKHSELLKALLSPRNIISKIGNKVNQLANGSRTEMEIGQPEVMMSPAQQQQDIGNHGGSRVSVTPRGRLQRNPGFFGAQQLSLRFSQDNLSATDSQVDTFPIAAPAPSADIDDSASKKSPVAPRRKKSLSFRKKSAELKKKKDADE